MFSLYLSRADGPLEECKIDEGVGFRNQDFDGNGKGVYPAITFAKGSCSVYFGGDPRGTDDAEGAAMLGFRCLPPEGYLPWTMALVSDGKNDAQSKNEQNDDDDALVTLSLLAKKVRKAGIFQLQEMYQ